MNPPPGGWAHPVLLQVGPGPCAAAVHAGVPGHLASRVSRPGLVRDSAQLRFRSVRPERRFPRNPGGTPQVRPDPARTASARARFGKLSLDGTKVRANASKRKAMSYARMREKERELEAEVEALLARARDTDAQEDARFGESLRGDELPQELRRREDRLAAIRAARARLEAAQREADDARGRSPGQDRNPKGGLTPDSCNIRGSF